MALQIVLMCAAVATAAIVICSSRLLRTICWEAIRRRHPCEIQVRRDGVSVRPLSPTQKEG
jgi:hypothetical protein